MLKHVVMWKFKDFAEGASKDRNLRTAKELLDVLPSRIPAIKSLEVGIDTLHTESSHDLVLCSAFENQQTLDEYQKHPEHVKVVGFLRKVHQGKVVVDFEV